MQTTQLKNYRPQHFLWEVQGPVATLTINRPKRKNPLTFDSYAEMRDLFRGLVYDDEIHAVIIRGAGGNFCSGGDVHEIIGPLTKMTMKELLAFTRMTGDLVKAMRQCPQLIMSAVEGVCAGAGAIIAMASDMRFGSNDSKVAFLFTRVGLAGCDMGACAILPRLIGQGRATELLTTGRSMSAAEAERWGFYNNVSNDCYADAKAMAERLAVGPTFAHGMTKTMLEQEWSMSVEQAIEAEAQAQAICMQTADFARAYQAFANKRQPGFKGD